MKKERNIMKKKKKLEVIEEFKTKCDGIKKMRMYTL